jgi:hypothetical protein
VADRYDVMAPAEVAGRARDLLKDFSAVG